ILGPVAVKPRLPVPSGREAQPFGRFIEVTREDRPEETSRRHPAPALLQEAKTGRAIALLVREQGLEPAELVERSPPDMDVVLSEGWRERHSNARSQKRCSPRGTRPERRHPARGVPTDGSHGRGAPRRRLGRPRTNARVEGSRCTPRYE